MLALDRVAKRYRLGEHASLLGWFRPRRELWAVRDLTLRIGAGESVGLIGHNGAGKTTVLKLLARITRPTRGSVATHGRVASLINLGAGFHRELTGRENIFLNGVILGLSRREVRQRFDEIVEFADLGPFIDTPLKRYSSGMYARLGFAVAAHVDPDILLVDEVLSVGDVAFQDRSIRKMLSFRDSGKAILFVSHNLSAVEMMCQRVIWLEHGEVRMQGTTAEVVQAYLDAVDSALVNEAAALDDGVDPDFRVQEVSLYRDGALCTDFDYGDPLRVRVHARTNRTLQRVACEITVRGEYGPLFAATADLGTWQAGPHAVECDFESLPLLPGLYRVDVQLRHAESAAWLLPRSLAAFRLRTDLAAFGSVSPVGATKSRGGFLAVPYAWRLCSAAGDEALAGLHLPTSTMSRL